MTREKSTVGPAKRGPGRPRKEQAPTKASPRLTTDQLDKIKHADVSNLIRKVKSGKTLTSALHSPGK